MNLGLFLSVLGMCEIYSLSLSLSLYALIFKLRIFHICFLNDFLKCASILEMVLFCFVLFFSTIQFLLYKDQILFNVRHFILILYFFEFCKNYLIHRNILQIQCLKFKNQVYFANYANTSLVLFHHII